MNSAHERTPNGGHAAGCGGAVGLWDAGRTATTILGTAATGFRPPCHTQRKQSAIGVDGSGSDDGSTETSTYRRDAYLPQRAAGHDQMEQSGRITDRHA